MADSTWIMDPQTGDLVFDEQGMLSVAEGTEAGLQRIRQTLLAWKGDFHLVPEHGTDYSRLLGEAADGETTDEVIREALFQEETVASIEELTVLEAGRREMEIRFSGYLEDGSFVSMEVNVDG